MVSSQLVVGVGTGTVVLITLVALTVIYTGQGNAGNTGSTRQTVGQGSGSIVHLFMWQHNDVAQECTNFLGPKGFKMVQISPPTAFPYFSVENGIFAWWLNYQPVDYTNLNSRMGTQAGFVNMVSTCHTAGVDIMVDTVANHHGGVASTTRNAWVYGAGGSGESFTPSIAAASYPKVAGRGSSGFHSNGDVSTGGTDWSYNCYNVIYDDLGGLQDLQGDCGTLVGSSNIDGCNSQYGVTCNTRTYISKYVQSMLCLGVRAFRFDAAKSQSPNDIWTYIDNAVSWANATGGCNTGSFNWATANSGSSFPTGPGNTFWGGNSAVWASASQIDAGFFPFVYMEVVDTSGAVAMSAATYTHTFTNNGASYQSYMLDFGSEYSVFPTFKGSSIAWLVNQATAYCPPGGWGNGATPGLSSINSVMFTDNHDDQRSAPGSVITNWFGGGQYANANTFMLAYPYGTPLLMSSYQFQGAGSTSANTDIGPPSDGNGNIDAIWNGGANTGCFAPLNPGSSNSNNGVSGGWICEHRWTAIANMVGWRNVVSAGSWLLRNIITGNNGGGLGFVRDGDGTACSSTQRCSIGGVFLVNNAGNSWGVGSYFVGLPDGVYCNIYANNYDATTYVDQNNHAVPVCTNSNNDKNTNDALVQVTNGYLTYIGGATVTVNAYYGLAIHTAARMPTAGETAAAPTLVYPTFSGVVGSSISVSPGPLGGTAPYTCTVTAGALAAGISLSSTSCTLSGTPTAAGSTSVTIKVTDAQSLTATTSVTQTVVAPAAAPTVTCTPATASFTTPGAVATVTCSVPTGSGTIAWSYTGTVPSGFSFSVVTNEQYRLTGTIANANSAGTLTVTATNAAGAGTASLPVTVQIPSSAIAYPQPSYSWNANLAITAIAPACGSVCGPYTLTPALPTGLSFSTVTGAITGTPTAAQAATAYTLSGSNSLSTTVTLKVFVQLVSTYTTCAVPGSFNAWATSGATSSMTLTSNYAWTYTGIQLTAGTQYQFKFYCGTTWFSSGAAYSAQNASNTIGATGIGTASSNMIFTPITSGAYTFKFNDASASFSAGPGAFTAPTLSYAVSGSTYTGVPLTWTASTAPGTAPYTYALTSGTLPSGLALTSTGSITGTVSSTASGTWTVTVTDSTGLTGATTVTYSITAPPTGSAPASVTCTPASSSYNANQAVSIACTVPAGTPTTSWTSSTLPSGLTLSGSAGTITGTTTTTAFSISSPITVTATTSGGSLSTTIYIGITPTSTAITYSPRDNPLRVGTAMTALSNSCGTTCGTYTIAPALPAGLSLNSGTGAISGTPTTATANTTYTITGAGGVSFAITLGTYTANFANCYIPNSAIGWGTGSATTAMSLYGSNAWKISGMQFTAGTVLQFKFWCTSAAIWYSSGLTYALAQDGSVSGTVATASANMQFTVNATTTYRALFNDNTKAFSVAPCLGTC